MQRPKSRSYPRAKKVAVEGNRRIDLCVLTRTAACSGGFEVLTSVSSGPGYASSKRDEATNLPTYIGPDSYDRLQSSPEWAGTSLHIGIGGALAGVP